MEYFYLTHKLKTGSHLSVLLTLLFTHSGPQFTYFVGYVEKWTAYIEMLASMKILSFLLFFQGMKKEEKGGM